MPAATRKRLRDKSAAGLTAGSIRSALASRVAQATPIMWQRAATSAGVAGFDAFFIHLGRSITDALQTVTESSEAARVLLRETQASLHAAIDARCVELVANINSAEASKSAALERELVAVDAALERWQAESLAVREALSSLSDADLEAQHESLSSRLGDLESQLHALPPAVVEPPFVGLLGVATALLSSISSFGRVLAPIPITAADLSLEGVPERVRLGSTLHLCLTLGKRHADQSAEELDMSLVRLARATQVEASLEGPGVKPSPLQSVLAPDASNRCLAVCLEIPTFSDPSATSFSAVAVTVFVDGLPASGAPLRVCRPVFGGISTPLQLGHCDHYRMIALCISPEGWIYAPCSQSDEVLVFDADGVPLPGLPLARFGLSKRTQWAAYAVGANGVSTLLLSDEESFTLATRLAAVDPVAKCVRWSADFNSSRGIAVLASLGIVIICDKASHSLVALRLSDGVRVGSLAVPGLWLYLAADPAAAIVYGTVYADPKVTVHAWSCVADGAGLQISRGKPVEATGSSGYSRILAVVPPAPGKMVSHLVVGTEESPELIVLSLPSLALVHTHWLEGMQVTGLASDPWGGALAVCDSASQALHVLAWPLPGMPPLQ